MTKISALPALVGADVALASDVIPILDMSETGIARNKKITIAELKTALGVVPYTDEQVRDVVAAALQSGTNITITPNDGADTITIDAAGGGGGGLTTEQVMDTIAAMLTQGTNVTLTYNDGSDTLTIAAAGGGGSSHLDVRPPTTSLFNLTTTSPGATLATGYHASKGLTVVRTDTGGGEGIGFLGKSVPAGSSWTAEMSIRVSPWQRVNPYLRPGMTLLEESTGKFLHACLNSQGGDPQINLYHFSALQTYGSSLYATHVDLPEFMRFRIVYDGTNYDFSLSYDDGITWVAMASAAKATYFTTAPDRIGIGLQHFSGFSRRFQAQILYYSDPDYV